MNWLVNVCEFVIGKVFSKLSFQFDELFPRQCQTEHKKSLKRNRNTLNKKTQKSFTSFHAIYYQ